MGRPDLDQGQLSQAPPAGADPPLRLAALRTPEGRSLPAGPFYKRLYCPAQLQFITTGTCRRPAVLLSERFCRCFVQRLAQVRQELSFLLIGWVLMPDHFHLLLKLRKNPPGVSFRGVRHLTDDEESRSALKTPRARFLSVG